MGRPKKAAKQTGAATAQAIEAEKQAAAVPEPSTALETTEAEKPEKEVKITASFVKRAVKADAEIRETYNASWLTIAKLCQAFHDLGYHRAIVDPKTGERYREFGEWAADAFDKSKSHIFGLMRVTKALKERNVSEEDMAAMPSVARAALAKVTASKVTPELVERAKTEPGVTFAADVEENVLVGVQKQDTEKRIIWWVPNTLHGVITEAIEKAGKEAESEKLEDRLDCIFGNYLAGESSATPLRPSLGILVKLGMAALLTMDALSNDKADTGQLETLLHDGELQAWLAAMDAMKLLPKVGDDQTTQAAKAGKHAAAEDVPEPAGAAVN